MVWHLLTLSFERILIHCLAALDLVAGVEQPFDCVIVQKRQAVQSMGRSIDWTLEDNMVDGLFFCVTLTGRRGGHTPFVQAGVENGCLHLRRRAFALDGRLRTEWSRCPGSMARRARDSVTPLRRSSVRWMLAKMGSY